MLFWTISAVIEKPARGLVTMRNFNMALDISVRDSGKNMALDHSVVRNSLSMEVFIQSRSVNFIRCLLIPSPPREAEKTTAVSGMPVTREGRFF